LVKLALFPLATSVPAILVFSGTVPGQTLTGWFHVVGAAIVFAGMTDAAVMLGRRAWRSRGTAPPLSTDPAGSGPPTGPPRGGGAEGVPAPARLAWARWPVLISLYLASRLAGLMALPIFLDERIHLRWAFWLTQGRRLRLPFISGRGLSVWLLAGVAPHAEDP